MKAWPVILTTATGAAVLALLPHGRPGASDRDAQRQHDVTRGTLTVTASLDGVIRARHVETIRAPLPGSATIVALADEGAAVTKGDLLARFDSSQLEREALRLEKETERAAADLHALERAELPMEAEQLKADATQARLEHDIENKFLEDSRTLVERNLISPQEIRQQELRVQGLLERKNQLQRRLELLTEHLHPSRLARARAQHELVAEQLATVQSQIAHADVRAPADGLIVFQPIATGGELRPVRVGDTIFQNQPFMFIPDLDDLQVECFVPESDLSGIAVKAPADIQPVAYPRQRLPGRVEHVSAMALARPGYPAWQKYFRLLVTINDSGDKLRPGMSANVTITTYNNPAAVRLPRQAVQWRERVPFCTVRTESASQLRQLQLGQADATCFEVIDGVEVGETVLIP